MKHRRASINGARTALVMLLVAAAVLLALGVVALARADSPDTERWLRSLFGRVFGGVAVAMAAVLGLPGVIGLWAMAGATAEGAVPALSATARRLAAGAALVAVVVVAVSVLAGPSGPLLLGAGLIGIVALASGGLAGAANYSPHRVRAIVSAVAVVVVCVGIVAVVLALPG